MRRLLFLKSIVASIFILAVGYVGLGFQNKKQATTNVSKSSVVLELFTSQGCSSCPPADVVLGKYALDTNVNVIPLAFHVDYWNYIGWKDPFSQHQFSERQRVYAENLNSNVYTPQLVINGKYQLNGSESSSIHRKVEQELLEKSDVVINVNSIQHEGNQLHIRYTIANANADSNVNIALVHKKVITAVKRGENSGRQLTNYNIVTEFLSQALKAKEAVLPFTTSQNSSEYAVVVFVQEKENGKILGAVQHEIN